MTAQVAMALVLGAACGLRWSVPPVGLAAAPLGLWIGRLRPGPQGWIVGLTGLVVAAAAWQGVRAPREAPDDVAALAPRRHLTIAAVVESPPEGGPGRWRAVARTYPVDRAGASRILVRFPVEAPRPAPGQEWRLSGRLRRLEGAPFPGGFDARAFWGTRGIHAAMHARDAVAMRPSPRWDDRLRAGLDALRTTLLRGLVTGLPPDQGALLGSLLLGAGAAPVPQALADTFRTAGLAHVLAASGAQVALVAGGLGFVVRGLGGGPRAQVGLAVPALVIYLGLTGASPGMVRATVMGLIGLAALALERSPVPFAALWGTVAAMVIADPTCVCDLGFQFSVLATYALLRLAHAGASWRLPGPAWLAVGLAAPIVTWAWLAPWQVWVFQALPLAGIPANWLAGPLVAFLTPWALGVAGLGCFWPEGAALANHLTAWALAALCGVAAWAAGLPGQVLTFAAPTPAVVVGLYGALALGWRHRWWALGTFGVAALLATWPTARGLEVAVLAVGQGDAIVVRTPGGRVVLVDGGPAGPGFDAGERVVLPYLRRLGVRRVDLLVATHPHLDHIGGLPAVGRALRVSEAWEAGLSQEGGAGEALLAAWLRQGIRWRTPAAGPLSWERDGVKLRVLPRRVRPEGGVNEGSLVVRLTYGRTAMLLPGDLEGEGERAALAAGEALSAQVLKVGHHGGRGASSRAWLEAVSPQLAVVSAGVGNVHGHPHAEALDRLAAAGAAVARTDRDGSVLLRSDGQTWEVTDGVSCWRGWRRVGG